MVDLHVGEAYAIDELYALSQRVYLPQDLTRLEAALLNTWIISAILVGSE